MTTILGSLTVAQRLTLADRLVSLQGCKEDTLFTPEMFIPTAQVRPLLGELERAGFIFWDKVGHRIHPGREIPKPPEVQGWEARRDALLRASPVGKKLLGLDQGPSPDARAGGMSPERREALLGASGLGRGMLKGDGEKKSAK